MSKELIGRLRSPLADCEGIALCEEAADTIEQQAAEIERLRAESLRLQYICGSAYQMAGAMDAPERFLDALSDPVSMTQEQIDALLPITGDEIYEAVTRLQSERTDCEAAASAAPDDHTAALQTIIGCFSAAEVEGLRDALTNSSDEHLVDLVKRRLMHALYAAQEAISPSAAPVVPEASAEPVAAQPELTVWYGAMPESNGKSNFTAILIRKGGDLVDGVTIDRSEYPERVRYEADRVRYLIGELSERPFILDYDADKHSGYLAQAAPAAPVVPEVPTVIAFLEQMDRRLEEAGYTHSQRLEIGHILMSNKVAAAPKEPTPQTSAHKQPAAAAQSPPNTHG